MCGNIAMHECWYEIYMFEENRTCCFNITVEVVIFADCHFYNCQNEKMILLSSTSVQIDW